MTLSMYQASVPLFRTLLGALSGVLDKGAAFAEEKKFDPSVLAACIAQLAGVDVPE